MRPFAPPENTVVAAINALAADRAAARADRGWGNKGKLTNNDKGEPIVLRTASEIEAERRKAKGYPPITRDGSHGE